jgi:minor curlin subunit
MRCGSEILKRTLAVVVLLAAIGTVSSASAGSVQRGTSNRAVSIQTIVQFGDNVQPVTIEESSRVNIARVIQIGGTGTVDATIIQNGERNFASVIQVGGTTNAAIGQSGLSNTAEVTQVGTSTNALLLQIGDMNTGAVRQFGRFNWLAIFQFAR